MHERFTVSPTPLVVYRSIAGQRGIEPRLSTRQADVLPLNYYPLLVAEVRVELTASGNEPDRLPLPYSAMSSVIIIQRFSTFHESKSVDN